MTTGVLFDVDGTLVDTNYLHAICWHDALRTADRVVPMNVLHRSIGMGSEELLAHVLGADRDNARDADIVHAHKVYYQRHWTRLTLLPSADALVRACTELGHHVVLASSADEEELAALRKVLDCDHAIAAATSGSDVEAAKPKPDLIRVALDKGGLTATASVFVGDSVWDARACAAAGVAFVGIASGGTSSYELTAAGAIEVWRDPADLLDHLDASAIGKLAHEAE